MAGPVAGGGGAGLRRFRRLADLTALVTFLLIIVGGVVRVSDSGLGCGAGGSGTKGWPLCGGDVIPLVGDENTLIEFSHRLLAAVVVVLIALLCWRAHRDLRDRNSWAFRGSIAAAVIVLIQAGLGGLTVEHSLKDTLVAAHLGTAMLLLGLLLWLSYKARSEAALEADRPVREPIRGLKPYAATAAVLLLCAIVAGGYMAGTEERGVNEVGPNIAGAHLACGHQFPTCGDGKFLPFGNNRLTDIHLTHRVFVYAATLAIIVLLSVAYARGSRDRLLVLAALLLLCQVLLGGMNVWLGEHASLIVAHLTVATLLWAAVISIAYRLAWLPSPARSQQRAPRAEASAAPA
ncbi:MAG TPA: COX15/CtaA family protein [Candidatus Limnocylindria bacterium]|nr:COX15/CtaA family protein [Candidatus Limnocylindria bacterium]